MQEQKPVGNANSDETQRRRVAEEGTNERPPGVQRMRLPGLEPETYGLKVELDTLTVVTFPAKSAISRSV